MVRNTTHTRGHGRRVWASLAQHSSFSDIGLARAGRKQSYKRSGFICQRKAPQTFSLVPRVRQRVHQPTQANRHPLQPDVRFPRQVRIQISTARKSAKARPGQQKLH